MANQPATITHPRIMCFRCKKPVERVATDVSYYSMSMRIRVFCHGETDEMELTKSFVKGLDRGLEEETGIAFAPQAANALSAPLQEITHG